MEFIGKCDECQRLWREYSAATNEHIKLESKLKLAALSRDDEAVIDLTPRVERAGERRLQAREAIRAHEKVAHTVADSAAAE